jgi:hypothetical protein
MSGVARSSTFATVFYDSVPSYVCAVLLRDDFNRIDVDDQAFCKDVILNFASVPLSDGYRYQISDGVGAATTVLPLLIKPFPAETARIKTTLLFGLFNEHGAGMGQTFSDFAVSAVVDSMWAEHPEDANSLLLGYVFLKPKLDPIRKAVRDENYKKNQFQFSESEILERFVTRHKDDIERIVGKDISFDQLPPLASVGERVLVGGFLLFPMRTASESHKKFLQDVCTLLSGRLLERDREDRFDYTLRQRFFDKFANFVLNSEKKDMRYVVT